MILELKQKGVVFVAASGRQYPSMEKLAKSMISKWQDKLRVSIAGKCWLDFIDISGIFVINFKKTIYYFFILYNICYTMRLL